MATASLKITTRDGTTECFSELVGDNCVDYAMMDKALHRLQEQSNSFLTVHVEKEKAMNQTNQSQSNCDAEDNDDDEESSEDDEAEEDKNGVDGDKPPKKKPKL